MHRVVSRYCWFALFGLLVLCGCDKPPAATPPQSPPTQAQRIVCGSPAVTEIVFALGCGDRVVGVSDFAAFPPEATTKQRIGGLINPNRERLLILQPDLILTQGNHAALAAFSSQQGIPFHTVKLGGAGELYTAIETFAALLEVPHKGEALIAKIRTELDTVAEMVRTQPVQPVLILFGRTPGDLTGMSSIGPTSFLDELLQIAGGRNIFADAKGAYPQISKESLLVRNPEVILELNSAGLAASAQQRLLSDWQHLEGISAVENQRIVFLSEEGLLIPGPRIGWIAKKLAQALHPELAW